MGRVLAKAGADKAKGQKWYEDNKPKGLGYFGIFSDTIQDSEFDKITGRNGGGWIVVSHSDGSRESTRCAAILRNRRPAPGAARVRRGYFAGASRSASRKPATTSSAASWTCPFVPSSPPPRR